MRVLMSAYACEPGRGSEPGAGWNWAVAASARHEVWVLTRSNNRRAIEAELERHVQPRLRFVYIDLPAWARFWKRSQHGIRAYYSLWQLLAAHRTRRLVRELDVDVVHHVTFANMWLPALACAAPRPFVLGPMAGGQRVPLRLYPALGLRGIAAELALSLRVLGRANPLVRLAWSRASVVLVCNDETRRALPRQVRSRALVRPNACIRAAPPTVARSAEKLAVYAGRIHRFKGLELALRALAHATDWRLLLVGDGPDRARLERVARKLGIDGRVSFEHAVDQAELWQILGRCAVLLLPTLKEGASFIAVEAQALGLPVVCFAMNGPAALARFEGARFELVRPCRPATAARELAAALERAAAGPRPQLSDALLLEGVARELDGVYRVAVAGAPAPLVEAPPA
jgi:glycosyltransferase involved in cell wall biosynthesis